MAQSWHDLLFMHWALPPSALRKFVPEQLELDLWDQKAWVAVVPFWMSGVRARGVPAIPGLSCFPELNVRTYVKYGGKPGVYFFSLDAASMPAVRAARAWYHLPYFSCAHVGHGRRGWCDLFVEATKWVRGVSRELSSRCDRGISETWNH
jgi:uncharacterized protein YqjF (DUF2071 family)